MSERLPGLPPPPPVASPRQAAAVVAVRRIEGEVELFWLQRDSRMSFAGGFYSLPGGRMDAEDALVPVSGADWLAATLKVTAARELFEETGLLIAEGAERLSPPELEAMRRNLVDKKVEFEKLLANRGLKLRTERFQDAGRWITPPFMPTRFDAQFFLVEVSPQARAEYWPEEHASGGWIRPAEALNQWAAGRALLHPPLLHVLKVLAEKSTLDQAAERMRHPPQCERFVPTRIEFQRGICLFPVETPTLPPATHTNAYLIGTEELVLVDPGSADESECERLFSFIETLVKEGAHLRAIILTHHHADHIGGVVPAVQKFHAPVWCHRRTADRLPVAVDRLLEEQEVLELHGDPSMRMEILHTPGHARGHICLIEQGSRAAVVGDMIAGIGTILIDPPEGEMSIYLQQLRRLRDSPVGTLYPAHGPAIADGPAKLTEYLLHREQRESKVFDAVAKGSRDLQGIARAAYDDLAEPMMPVAERSTLAILEKLIADGRVRCEQTQYVLV